MEIKTVAHARMSVVTTQPIVGLSSRKNSLNPMKNNTSATCTKNGRAAAISNTRYRTSPSYRNWRIRTWARGDKLSWDMYSCNHCLTRMPSEAVTRLHIKLENHSPLILTIEGLGLKAEGVRAGAVVLTNPGVTAKLVICWEICKSRRADTSPESSSSF